MRRILSLMAVVAALICGSLPASAQKSTAVDELQRKAREAGQRAASNTIEPHEINNIERRRTLMGKPGLVQYVVFMSKSGQPIEYFVADGKCTSSDKRLTPGERLVRGDGGEWNADFVMKSASEDGTYGHSSPYIYCKTVDGKYKQWNGQYYASDYPIELTIKPIVIDTSGRNQQQQ
ncbi:MAG: hypothetical protein Q8P36_01490 [bacterium]|nr:hypothetical protein [bacterium]